MVFENMQRGIISTIDIPIWSMIYPYMTWTWFPMTSAENSQSVWNKFVLYPWVSRGYCTHFDYIYVVEWGMTNMVANWQTIFYFGK